MDEMKERGWTFSWEWDESPDLSWMTEEELKEDHEVLGLVLKDRRGHVLDSLWGIVDPPPSYARDLEQEMVEQALEDVKASIFEAI